MTNKTFLTAHGVIYMFFALALFFGPTLLWPNYGVQLNDQYAVFLSQHNSIFLGGIGIISFLFRHVENSSSAARSILTGLIWTNLLGVIITLYAGFTGIFTGFGWSDPAFFALLAVLSFVQLGKNK
ncbi:MULTISPECIES: hypothetical protein [Aliiroseovarius]|uniref:hypothetical protein n=1 Tax=Aliiroseovarius TaxID=1658781 RepID=UPI00156A2771|nr:MULTISPECIES: hypothetical protein [Aliiroseovarius]NRP13477.1 hypothetical protein [Aliiroseovarius sp. xm-d-517]NRP42648.1 hypothetical protein [Aliiroseovarius sp. xm-m-339-2]NRP63560.1 hypothetical protein [Aliiroseovarius sp. xm-a-151]UWP88812.1 hypothetical protein K3J57_13240 [Aliiroseovarius crassostreae]UWQ07717.1 hypothetical protein K3X25_13400 [Aliiroseovarius crassostreae]